MARLPLLLALLGLLASSAQAKRPVSPFDTASALVDAPLGLDASLDASSAIPAPKGELVQVNLVHRHGARTPDEGYLAPFASAFNEIDSRSGELTDVGREMLEANGRALGERYVKSEKFVSSEPHVFSSQLSYRSTDVNRVLESAQSLLRGFFPEKEAGLYVPVHTVPTGIDRLLEGASTCPSAMLRRAHSEVVKEKYILSTFGNLADVSSLGYSVMEWAGLKEQIKSRSPSSLFLSVADNLYCAQAAPTVKIPAKIEELAAKIQYVNKLDFFEDFRLYEQTGQCGGLLTHTMTSNMENQVKSDDKNDRRTKFYLYSAHDTTVGPFMAALNLYTLNDQWVPPPFGSMSVLELRKVSSYDAEVSKAEDYLVNLLFTHPSLNDTGKYASQLLPVALRCPETTNAAEIDPWDPKIPVAYQCPFPNFTAYVESLYLGSKGPFTGPSALKYSAEDPCCFKPSNFSTICKENVGSVCNAYSSYCPATTSANLPTVDLESPFEDDEDLQKLTNFLRDIDLPFF